VRRRALSEHGKILEHQRVSSGFGNGCGPALAAMIGSLSCGQAVQTGSAPTGACCTRLPTRNPTTDALHRHGAHRKSHRH
jgi:hypothetical protein